MSPFEQAVARRARTPRALQIPRTPDPLGHDELHQPPPPPPRARLRLRRNAPKLKTNTPQFLQSVDSADIPIPSIEEPHVYDEEDMIADTLQPTSHSFERSSDNLQVPPTTLHRKSLSPPKTPAPEDQLSPGVLNWYQVNLDSLQYSESEASRPSTARSSGTFASVFSHLSHLSERDAQQYGIAYSRDAASTGEDTDMTVKPTRLATLKRAHWTKAMEQHLWKTFMMYQQDATVTPYKTGANGVPPSGVLDRVVTIAKQTWTRRNSRSAESGPAVEWPHSRAAARAHLRELCISLNRRDPRASRLRERSITPSFPTAIRFRNRRLGPSPSPCPFGGRDMAMSLAMSTSTSMQPNAPLNQLTQMSPELHPPEPLFSLSSSPLQNQGNFEASRPRLASPFTSNTYGPSSTLNNANTPESESRTQSQTTALTLPKALGSPMSLVEEHTHTGKRRARQSLLELPKPKRPSLTSDFWVDPRASASEEPSSSPMAPLEPASSPADPLHQRDISAPQVNLFAQLNAIEDLSTEMETDSGSGALLAPPSNAPRRLGSPFSGKLSSFSFPGRISRTRSVPRAFATIHHVSARQKAPRTPVPRRALEDKLRDLCRRARRRSRSPSQA